MLQQRNGFRQPAVAVEEQRQVLVRDPRILAQLDRAPERLFRLLRAAGCIVTVGQLP